jgi:hypothetical protein
MANTYRVSRNILTSRPTFRILNTTTGRVNPNRFYSESAARAHVSLLKTWDSYNQSKAGKSRTKDLTVRRAKARKRRSK